MHGGGAGGGGGGIGGGGGGGPKDPWEVSGMIQTGLQKLFMSLVAKYDLSGPSAMQFFFVIALSLIDI